MPYAIVTGLSNIKLRKANFCDNQLAITLDVK